MRPVIFRLIKVSFKFVSSTRFFSSSSAFLRRHSHEKSSEYLSFSLHPRERQDSPAVRLQANQKRSVLRRLAPQSHLPGCSEVSERHLQMMSSYRKWCIIIMLSNSFIRLKKSYFFILKSCNAALFVLGKSDGVFVVINCFCMLTFQTSIYSIKMLCGKTLC